MTLPANIESLSREDLLLTVVELFNENAELKTALHQQQLITEELRAAIEQLKRDNKREAAPFSKGSRVKNPRKPGRKPGSGDFSYRPAPAPESFTQAVIDVPVSEVVCPSCGGELAEESQYVVTLTDIPKDLRPEVKGYRVTRCRCLACGKKVRGQHPEVASDQYGATAHRIGERTKAVVHALHYGDGIPVRRVPGVIKELTGIKITQSAITQDAVKRAAASIGVEYQKLRASVQSSEHVNTDDTGWRLGGEAAFLMVFETTDASVYQIRRQHRNEEVREIIPADYQGVMSTDRGKSYEAKELEKVKQQKCIGHIQRSITEVLEKKRGGGRGFGVKLKGLLKEAVEVRQRYQEGEQAGYEEEAKKVKQEITNHLKPRHLSDADNRRLLKEIGRHHEQGNLLRFLDDPRIEPTNNRAERALRPAVIARKVSQCSKNERGAEAFSAFTSVVRTIAKKGVSTIAEGLNNIFQSDKQQAAPT